MDKIQSFQVDHRYIRPGIYVSRIDGDMTTYDLRTRKPNTGELMDHQTMHSFEHLFATYARNSGLKDSVIYFGPMGCQTGFYLLIRNAVHQEVLALIRSVLLQICDHDGEIFGKSEIECGNYQSLSLESAKEEATQYYHVIKDWTAKDLSYPGKMPQQLIPVDTVDILINNGTIVTMSDDKTVFEGAVAIKDGQIVAVGATDELNAKYSAVKVINAENKIVMPGLINTHTHAAMTLFRGVADDIPLKEWLEQHIWPMEAKHINAETAVLGAKLAIAEMIRCGTTTINDMYFFADEVAWAAKQVGIRAVLAEGLLDFPTPSIPNPDQGISHTEKLIQKWQGDRLITIAVATHSPYTCSAALLKNSRELSRKYGAPLHIHVAETKQEVEDLVSKTGMTPVVYLNSLDFLGENVIAVHCVHLTEEDIRLLAENRVGVAHNPNSNAKLASGIAPVPDLLKAGIKVGLGTDGAASNNKLDMFGEMAMAAKIHKANLFDPLAVDAYTAVKMATIDGARVLGLEDKIGSLEKGKQADIIVIDTMTTSMTPMYNVYSHLAYAFNATSVETVIVDGKLIMEDHNLVTIDERKIIQDVAQKTALF